MNMFARFDENQCMAYNSISIKHYIKSHLELQREITLFLHAYVQCVYIVQEKYQIVPSKAVVRVDWPVYGL